MVLYLSASGKPPKKGYKFLKEITMVKLWARTIKEHATLSKCDFIRDEEMQWSDFFDYVREICNQMDLPTPVILKTHLFNFAKFNYVRFVKSDFVENVDFDYLLIENVNK